MDRFIPKKKHFLMKSEVAKKRFFLLALFCVLFSSALIAQNITVRGTVVSSTDGEPMIGVTVIQVGAMAGTATDFDGAFTITVPADARLRFNSIGYLEQTIDVNGRTSLTVTMHEDFVGLEELVVVGFQAQRRINLTGAVTTVGSEVFENRPVSNIGQALRGVVPNLNITIPSGAPDAVPSWNIRGGTSIVQDGANWVVARGAPLILVDGVEYTPTLLNQLNPNDIYGMTVIKDASAAAIYGTRATYGVILITTRSGQFNQRGRVQYSFEMAFDSPSHIPDILDAHTLQLAQMNRMRWRGQQPSSFDYERLEAIYQHMFHDGPMWTWAAGGAINWVGNHNPYDLLVRRSSPTQRHNLSFSGGSDRIAYHFSFGYQNQQGLYRINNDTFDRYNLLMRVNARVTDRFSVAGRFSYNRTIHEVPHLAGGKGNLWAAMRNEPNKNINQPIRTAPTDPIPNAWTDNILAWVSYGARTRTLRQSYALSIAPEFVIIPGILTAHADLAFTPSMVEANRRSPQHEYVNISWTNKVSEIAEMHENRARLEMNRTEQYLMNIYLNFNKTLRERHRLSAVLGYSEEQVEWKQLVLDLRALYSADIQNPAASFDPTLHSQTHGAWRRTARGTFARFNYNFDDRYMFEANMRYDGSSRFTPQDRFVFFPSFSAGWNISNEEFFDFASPVVSFMRVRGSWGRLGSQPGQNYPFQAVMGSSSNVFLLDGNRVPTINVPGLVTPRLTWQTATTTNFGLDMHFLRGRLQSGFDIYRRFVDNILVAGDVPFPAVLGAAAPLVNSGELLAYGWEWSVNFRDRTSRGLTYRAGFVLSDERTRVVHFPANAAKLLTTLYDGMYTGDIWGHTTGGILQEQDLRPYPGRPGHWIFDGPQGVGQTFFPGDVWLRDLNGDGWISSGDNTYYNPGDRRIIGNSTPRFRFGITGDVSYRGFDANVFFQGVGKRDLWIGNNAFWGAIGGAGSRWMHDRSWTPYRTDARFPMYGAVPAVQSAFIINGAFLRLQQASLGYTLPQEVTRRANLERVRFHVSGFNLFTITAIPSVFDPEQISDAYPPRRTLAFGAQIHF